MHVSNERIKLQLKQEATRKKALPFSIVLPWYLGLLPNALVQTPGRRRSSITVTPFGQPKNHKQRARVGMCERALPAWSATYCASPRAGRPHWSLQRQEVGGPMKKRGEVNRVTEQAERKVTRLQTALLYYSATATLVA